MLNHTLVQTKNITLRPFEGGGLGAVPNRLQSGLFVS